MSNNYQDINVLCSGDLHLYDKEIGSTINYAEESTKNLIRLHNHYLNSDADFMILGGDIQHGMPENIKHMADWRYYLTQMKEAIYNRLKSKGILDLLEVYDAKGNLMDIKSGKVSCLFSVKGNHDFNRRVDRAESFTFFDDLVKGNIISVPHKIIYNKTEIHFYNSKDWNKPIAKKEDTLSVIGVYHDPIVQKGRVIDTYLGKSINPDDSQMFANIDLAILNDIHLIIEPYKVNTIKPNGIAKETTVITHGSIGRTSYNESHKRDYARLTKVKITADNYLEYELEEMELTPYKEFFNLEQVIKIKKRQTMFAEFSLEIEKVDTIKKNMRDEIEEMSIDDKVKERCIELLEQVAVNKVTKQ